MEYSVEILKWVEEKIGGLTLISILFIYFGIIQILGAQTAIVTPSGTMQTGIGLSGIILSALFFASGISLWARKFWSWVLSLLASVSVGGFGLYGVYTGIVHEAIVIAVYGVIFTVIGIAILIYLNRDYVRNEFN